MQATNLLLIMADEHSKRVLGCHGNDFIDTPNLDRLAKRGTVFDAAYTPCPICVPARAAMQTGRYVHATGHWSNAEPYSGEPQGWGHRLLAAGHRVDSVGKLHFRSTEDENGYGRELIPMHVLDGVGDLQGLLRRPPPKRPGVRLLADKAGAGQSSYARYDDDILGHSNAWLRERAAAPDEKPWVLFVSFVRPHFPLIAPPNLVERYLTRNLPLPFRRSERPMHPMMAALREVQNYDDYFTGDDHVRLALAAYYGMVTAIDAQVGELLTTLDEAGLTDSTRIVYTSDHGDNLGNRGFWGKSNMYEDSAGIPLIIAGPGIPAGRRVAEPASLVDIHQTAIEATGNPLTDAERAELPGVSLIDLANGARPARTVLSEYHAVGSITAFFMIRVGRWKYIHFPGYASQLFDLEADPLEANDLGTSPSHSAERDRCEQALRKLLDPDEVNARAFADQAALIEKHGGAEAVSGALAFPHTPAPGEEATVE
ncbi:MAG: sulfatase-like hydrolase/transferase [Variovorax sp.]